MLNLELSVPINCQEDIIRILKRVRQSSYILERDFIKHESLKHVIGEVYDNQNHQNQSSVLSHLQIKEAIRGTWTIYTRHGSVQLIPRVVIIPMILIHLHSLIHIYFN